MRSPYAVLGIARTADQGTIKSAYRSLAKIWHPDQNPDVSQAGARFAEITLAYRLLIDPERRRRFDNGEIDARGRRRPGSARAGTTSPFAAFREAWKKAQARPEPPAEACRPGAANDDLAGFDEMVRHIFGENADPADIGAANRAPGTSRVEDPLSALDDLFARWKELHEAPAPRPPVETFHTIDIDLDAVLDGIRAEVRGDDGATVPVEVPRGTADGTELVVAYGDNARPRQARVTVRYRPHPSFRVEARDIHTHCAIELGEAVLGGEVRVEGLEGSLQVEIPAWATGNSPIVVPGRGLPGADGKRGNLYVHLHIRLPGQPDERLVDLMRWDRKTMYF